MTSIALLYSRTFHTQLGKRYLSQLIHSSTALTFSQSRRWLHNEQFPSQQGALRQFSSAKPLPQKETITLHFHLADGQKKTAKAKLGDNLLDVVLQNHLDIDGYGACEGTLACSTCHLVFKQPDFEKLHEKPTDEELDMLDLAYGLSETSRLGCQVIVTKEMNGWEITVPAGVADARG